MVDSKESKKIHGMCMQLFLYSYNFFRAKIKEPKALTDSVLMGHRFTAEEALSGRIVEKICDMEELLDTAVQMGQAAVGKNKLNRDAVKHSKKDLYSDIISVFQNENLSRQGILQAFSQFNRKSRL